MDPVSTAGRRLGLLAWVVIQMQTVADASTRELINSRLRLADDLVFTPQVHGDDIYYHLESRSQGVFFRIGYAEYVFVSLLNGSHTVAQALTLTIQQLKSEALTQSQGLQVATWLLENQLAQFSDNRSRAFAAHPPSPPRRFNPFWLKLPLGSPDKWLTALTPYWGWLFAPWATVMGLVIVALGAISLFTLGDRFVSSTSDVLAPHNWLWLGIAWICLKVAHEMGHGVACKYYGGEVRETGLIFVLLAPMAYVDVTSCWRFPSRWQRIHVAAAGMYIELLLAAIAAILWSRVDSIVVATFLRNVILMASLSTVLFNANPLMRFDGYYILADLLKIPNLATEGAQFIRAFLQTVFFGVGPGKGLPEAAGARKWCIRFYGIGAAFWRLVVCASLATAASVMWHGAGVWFAVAGLAGWFGQPLVKLVQDMARRYREARVTFWRAIAAGISLASLVLAVLVYVPWPCSMTAPAVVEYADLAVVRSRAPGFVRQVHVTNGEKVTAGQLLVELQNESLLTEMRELEALYMQQQARLRGAVDQHDAAESQVAQQNLHAVVHQLEQARQRVAGLKITAPTTGTVIRRNLAQTRGAYFDEGEEILMIGDDSRKELVISIGQAEVDAIAPLVGTSVKFRVGGRLAHIGQFHRLEPRASSVVPHPALSSTVGGPLSVRLGDDNQPTQLTQPRFRGVIRMKDSCTCLASGERGYAILGQRPESIGEYIWIRFSKWIEDLLCHAGSR